MPEMILIRVDLPAPLSPTRAVTSPAGAAKSTSLSACTAPNRLFTPRSSSRGVLATSWPPSGFRRYGPDPDKRPARTSVRRPGWRLGPAYVPQPLMPAAWQAEAAAPAQMSDAFRKPSEIILPIVSLAVALVTGIGVRMMEGTSFWPLLVFWAAMPLAAEVLPLTRLTASCAASSASGLIAL